MGLISALVPLSNSIRWNLSPGFIGSPGHQVLLTLVCLFFSLCVHVLRERTSHLVEKSKTRAMIKRLNSCATAGVPRFGTCQETYNLLATELNVSPMWPFNREQHSYHQ